MKTTELITDNAINIVFYNTNFGNIPPRVLIEKGLKAISDGFEVGHTLKCCLLELGLIFSSSPNNYLVSAIGKKYLEIITTS